MELLVLLAGYVDASTLAVFIQTCKMGSLFKQDIYWRPLLLDRWPDHPAKRAYHAYARKARYEMNKIRQVKRAERLETHSRVIALQRDLVCYVCFTNLDATAYIWSAEPTWFKARRSDGFISRHPVCSACVQDLIDHPRERKISNYCRPAKKSKHVTDLDTFIHLQRLRKAGRRLDLRVKGSDVYSYCYEQYLLEVFGQPTNLLAFGSKRSAKIRWLYRCWKKNPSPATEAAFRSAKAKRFADTWINDPDFAARQVKWIKNREKRAKIKASRRNKRKINRSTIRSRSVFN